MNPFKAENISFSTKTILLLDHIQRLIKLTFHSIMDETGWFCSLAISYSLTGIKCWTRNIGGGGGGGGL